MASKRYSEYELSVCSDCIQLLANGDSGESTSRAAEGMRRTWGNLAVHLVVGGEDLGFSVDRCDGCGAEGGGERFGAVALIPVELDR